MKARSLVLVCGAVHAHTRGDPVAGRDFDRFERAYSEALGLESRGELPD